jgi:hypothetical protein
MSVQRLIFEINTDTGTEGDTGVLNGGDIRQLRWNPTTPDTGGDLQVAVLPRAGDTGDGFVVYNDNDCLGANFVRSPVMQAHHSDGFDTGSVEEVHFVCQPNDRLRVKVIPGGAAVAGRLYVWVKD